ncbi:MAG: thioredoxin domain-containing protein [Terriglobia bacterium]
MTLLENSQRNATAQANRLSREKSPYLLQHAYNPVDWYPWGDEAFEAARREDKPIFLSIGYSTCHWCHVMEHESFEDSEVAKLMNEVFISIKVDREERPDIDNVYMRVCQMVTGSGGWPLTIVMTPEKKPFFAGTYIPRGERFGRQGMLTLIPSIGEVWRTRREDVARSAEEIMQALQQASAAAAPGALSATTLEACFEELSSRFDGRFGGFGRAPKFPTPHTLLFLLRYAKRSGDASSLEMVEHTLSALRRGGIYDHVGFGFHRYSTDPEWLVPHFEKMLYDQAMLVMAFAEAFQSTRREAYAATVREVLAYVSRVLTDSEGGFYSAEDADSEGVEGKFYLWKEPEIRNLLGDEDAAFVIQSFGVQPGGNFPDPMGSGAGGENILHQAKMPAELARELDIAKEHWYQRWESARLRLFAEREKRVHPHKDDKILTDWNGLMIAAYAKAAQVLEEPRYTQAARRAADFILNRMKTSEGSLLHRYRESDVGVPGHLDDYAFMIWGLIELYEATFETEMLREALELNDYALLHFWDEANGGFFFTADNQESVLVRSKEIYDGAVPSGNSVTLFNLLRLARLTGRADLEEKADRLSAASGASISESPAAYALWMVALDFALGPSYEVVIAGNPQTGDTQAMLKALGNPFLPNKVTLLRSDDATSRGIKPLAEFTQLMTSTEGKATAYVCRNFQCALPTTDPQEMLRLLNAV